MKYLIAYKQDENTYLYVTNIGQKIETTLFYANGLDFLSKTNAENVCNYLNEYNNEHKYIVVEYKYSLKEA